MKRKKVQKKRFFSYLLLFRIFLKSLKYSYFYKSLLIGNILLLSLQDKLIIVCLQNNISLFFCDKIVYFLLLSFSSDLFGNTSSKIYEKDCFVSFLNVRSNFRPKKLILLECINYKLYIQYSTVQYSTVQYSTVQ